MKSIILLILVISPLYINCGELHDFQGTMCRSGKCPDCARDPNNSWECAKITSERTSDGLYDFFFVSLRKT